MTTSSKWDFGRPGNRLSHALEFMKTIVFYLSLVTTVLAVGPQIPPIPQAVKHYSTVKQLKQASQLNLHVKKTIGKPGGTWSITWSNNYTQPNEITVLYASTNLVNWQEVLRTTNGVSYFIPIAPRAFFRAANITN